MFASCFMFRQLSPKSCNRKWYDFCNRLKIDGAITRYHENVWVWFSLSVSWALLSTHYLQATLYSSPKTVDIFEQLLSTRLCFQMVLKKLTKKSPEHHLYSSYKDMLRFILHYWNSPIHSIKIADNEREKIVRKKTTETHRKLKKY